MRENGLLTPLAIMTLVAMGMMGRAVYAQRPERPQEVRVPGIDIMLRAGWQLLFHDGCRVAVPPSWRADPDAGFVSGPVGDSLSVQRFTITSWFAHKALVKAAFGRVNVVHEDSDRRLWLEIGDKHRTQHYIDVPHGLSTCTGLLEIRAATMPSAEDTTTIADSIGPAPAKWP